MSVPFSWLGPDRAGTWTPDMSFEDVLLGMLFVAALHARRRIYWRGAFTFPERKRERIVHRGVTALGRLYGYV